MRPESEPARRAEAQQFRGELQNDPRAREEVEAIREAGAWLDGELARSEAPVLSPERRAKLLEAANAQKRDQPTRAPVRKSRPWQRWATAMVLPALATVIVFATGRKEQPALVLDAAPTDLPSPAPAGSQSLQAHGASAPLARSRGITAELPAHGPRALQQGAQVRRRVDTEFPEQQRFGSALEMRADPIGRSEAPSGESYDASTTTAKTRVSWAPTAA